MASYYTNNFSMFYHKDVGVVNHFRLEDFDNMYPWEREIYMTMMNEKIKELSQK